MTYGLTRGNTNARIAVTAKPPRFVPMKQVRKSRIEHYAPTVDGRRQRSWTLGRSEEILLHGSPLVASADDPMSAVE